MPYSDYREPGVDVVIENREEGTQSRQTRFYPVFIGTGVTTRDKVVTKEGITVNTSSFPEVQVRVDLVGEYNMDAADDTTITIETLTVKGDPSDHVLTKGTDFEVVSGPTISAFDNYTEFTVNLIDPVDVTSEMTLYDVEVKFSNVDDDFDLKLVGTQDRFLSSQRFGPVILEENGQEFLNDIGIAAEMAFRMGVPNFYYLEVPRDYGMEPTKEDFREAIEKIYFKRNAYRLIPLSMDSDVNELVIDFVTSASNPIDKRESVAFITGDMDDIISHKDIDELVDKVGGYSQSIDKNRVSNVYFGESVEMTIRNTRYVLPPYYMSAAVAALDSIIGLVQPLSTRRLNVFDRIHAPRYRPREWNMLAERGVFIVKKDFDTGEGIVRHQLTTSQSSLPEDQEYSVVKNFDVVTNSLRDRFSPYAGRENITGGYIEKLDATLTTVTEEILERGLARSLEVTTSWRQRPDAERQLYTRIAMQPVYPANNLDIYLVL